MITQLTLARSAIFFMCDSLSAYTGIFIQYNFGFITPQFFVSVDHQTVKTLAIELQKSQRHYMFIFFKTNSTTSMYKHRRAFMQLYQLYIPRSALISISVFNQFSQREAYNFLSHARYFQPTCAFFSLKRQLVHQRSIPVSSGTLQTLK